MASDAEVEQLRAAVSCAVVLEKRGYRLDEQESSKRSLKYRRGEGEIIIVNHDGHGWWDTGSTAKGDVFTLVQYLDPNLNFGQVRRELRSLVGMTPTFQPAERASRDKGEHIPPDLLWASRPPVGKGSRTWTYLTRERGLTAEIITAAVKADTLRAGPYASAWFAHRDAEGAITGIEMRGPNYRGFSRDGDKSLFRLQLGHDAPTRLAVVEAPIDAMSMAVLEGMRKDTLYVSTGGGMGPGTIAALEHELAKLAKRPGVLMVAATDADAAGERYAARLTELAASAGVPAQRATPTGHNDWNDVLRATGQGRPAEHEAIAAPPLTTTAAATNGAETVAGMPVERALSTRAGASDLVVDVLNQMRRSALGGSDPGLTETIQYLAEHGADPNRRAQLRFQHHVAYALQDLEKNLGVPLDLSPGTRSEMTSLAASAPGLENERMLALMSATAAIRDAQLVREIRRVAGNIGLREEQSSPDIQSRIDALESKVRLTPRLAAPATTEAPVLVSGPVQILYQRSVLDTLLSGMRSKEPGNQPPICSMADRLAAFEKRMTDERDERAIQSALVSGRFALGALQGFSSGEGAAIMNRIHEAAKTDSGGVASVLAEMREAGRVADLRGQFNTALSTDLRMGNALDRAAAALDRYGQDRGKVEDIVERRPDAKAITARLERMDAAIGEAAATTPSRTDGRSLLADLSRQPAEVLRRAADTAKSALLPPLSADKISQSLPVPSMSTG